MEGRAWIGRCPGFLLTGDRRARKEAGAEDALRSLVVAARLDGKRQYYLRGRGEGGEREGAKAMSSAWGLLNLRLTVGS